MDQISRIICNYCVLDSSIPGTYFDATGRCQSCANAESNKTLEWFNTSDGFETLNNKINSIVRDGHMREYHCIIGLSGGLDSAYLAYFLRTTFPELKLLAIHVDAGWNSEPAVRNIENVVKELEIDLITNVIDWNEMRALQVSFLKAGVLNQDIPQDHAFFASLYQTAHAYKIPWFLSGVNFSSECVNPTWNYPAIDLKHLKGVHNCYEKNTLKNFPKFSMLDLITKKYLLKSLKILDPLNYIDYNRDDALAQLKSAVKWADYGEKHSESRWTKFYQDIYLPKKFNFDKRAMHLSSRIVAGQISRKNAIEVLKTPIIDDNIVHHEIKFIARKLNLETEDLLKIILDKPRSHFDYPNNYWLFDMHKKLKKVRLWKRG